MPRYFTPKTVLRRALRNLDEGRRWTKQTFAVDKDGNDCHAKDPNAVAFCLLGSLRAVAPTTEIYLAAKDMLRPAVAADRKAWKEAPTSIAGFNDRQAETFADIKRVLNRAIRGERRKPGSKVL